MFNPMGYLPYLLGFGSGLVACNYASFIVTITIVTYNMCNKDTKIKCYPIFFSPYRR